LGAQNEASELAVKIARQIGPQTTIAITPATASSTGSQKAMRIGRKTSPAVPSRISRQVTVGFAPQAGSETGLKINSGKPFVVAVDTTTGTVLGTVLTVVPGMSI
jgi:hypothetical protein